MSASEKSPSPKEIASRHQSASFTRDVLQQKSKMIIGFFICYLINSSLFL